jgi:hypothetical protein
VTVPNGTPGQFVRAVAGIFKADVLKPLFIAPSDAIITQNKTKGCNPDDRESIMIEKNKLKMNYI